MQFREPPAGVRAEHDLVADGSTRRGAVLHRQIAALHLFPPTLSLLGSHSALPGATFIVTG